MMMVMMKEDEEEEGKKRVIPLSRGGQRQHVDQSDKMT